MKRWLHRDRIVSGDVESLAGRLRGELRELLVAGTASPPGAPAGDGSFLVRLAAPIFGAERTKAVRMTTGVATAAGNRHRIPLSWQADPASLAFPTFDGAIELEPLARTRAQLTIVGSYAVPAGVVGVMVDSILLHGVAERTADRLLDGLEMALGGPVAEPPPPAGPDAPMVVADVMTPDPLVLGDDQPLRTAALLLFNYGFGGAPVVNAHGALVGVLSEADLLEREARPRAGPARGGREASRRRDALTVGEACSRPALVTAADATLHDAARVLLDHEVARLVVVDGSSIAGIVTRHDVLRALLRADDLVQHAAAAVIERAGEPELTATVEWGVVTLTGTISRLSLVRVLTAEVEALDGVMAVIADAVDYRRDDVTPVVLPFT